MSIAIEDRLVAVADAFSALIAADAFFAGDATADPVVPPIPVATERKGDTSALIAAALAKLGIAVAVIMPDGYGLTRRGTDLVMTVRLVAQVDEQAIINRQAAEQGGYTYRSALAAATRIMKAVDRQPNGLDPAGLKHRAGLNEFTLPPDRPFVLLPSRKFVTYQITAFTEVVL